MSENETGLQKAQTVLPQNLEDFAMSPETLIRQANIIEQVVSQVMKKDMHFGLIPGCGNKPSLLKPGAEKLLVTFRLSPEIQTEVIDMLNGHKQFNVVCRLVSIVTGAFIGSGIGSCTTMESKFRFRKAEQKCPECGECAIIKGKQEYGGGWVCFKKKGGCGAKFQDGDPVIENQEMGRVEHDNPADYYNTCLKMAKKRALVDAALTCTAASDVFTQDIEDLVSNGTMTPKAAPEQAAQTQQEQPDPQAKTKEQSSGDQEKTTYPPSGKKITVGQVGLIQARCAATGHKEEALKTIKDFYKVESTKDLLMDDMPTILEMIGAGQND